MAKSTDSKLKQFFWMPINNKETARKAAMQGVWAAGFVSVITAIVTTIAIANNGALANIMPQINAWSFLDAGIFAAIAWGIYKMSRVASVTGLVLYIAEQIVIRASNPKMAANGIFVVVLLVFAFVNALRGTFAYQKFQRISDIENETKEP
jgi:hypothetical protein